MVLPSTEIGKTIKGADWARREEEELRVSFGGDKFEMPFRCSTGDISKQWDF